MDENTRKKLNIELRISNYLSDLQAYAEGAYYYLTGSSMITDKEEIIASLKSVPDIIETIEILLAKWEELHKNEQLQ